MGTYASAAAVAARLPTRDISASSKPTLVQVDEWIAELEAELHLELKAAGFTTPVVGAEPIAYLRARVVSKATSRWLEGSTAITDREDSALAIRLSKEWDDFVALIRTNDLVVSNLIGQAAGQAAAGKGDFRSHVTHHPDGESVATGDFDPTFTRGGRW